VGLVVKGPGVLHGTLKIGHYRDDVNDGKLLDESAWCGGGYTSPFSGIISATSLKDIGR
jgi:hypothetical protein